ncbi:hypothetical protein L2E82_37181 [Cichorium intybus]|uniref:Uncharacterized protein n=1 Tax=Cichorium intybus TaxID=13427 RepID=A0ACB9AEH0_CICIN|nr:hypothetical protein L2E82_37181 [Cichorium intybus]
MSLKVPSDLINQSQIGFRQDAGLSSFNPQDPTLNPLPTVRHSISALDSSPSRLECKHCEENLLRGSQSLICIYCGQCQANDQPPEPLLFNSTTGYRWLLQSLNLIPSEMIEPLVEEKRRNKVGTPVEDGRALSEFLDVQIKWPNEVEIPETSYVNKMLDHVSSFTVNTVGSYNFEQRDSGSDASEEHAVSSRNDQSDGFEDEDNLSLFQKADVSETAAMSSDFSDNHDAGIQPVNSSTQNDDSKVVSFDLSRNSSFGDDTETQSVNSRRDNEDSSKTTADVSSDLNRDENEEEIESVKDSKTASVSFDLSDNESSEHVDSRTQNEDLNRNSSSGDDTEIQSMNFTKQNEDSETADMSFNLKDRASSVDESAANSSTQNEDSKAIADMAHDSNRNSSSGDESSRLYSQDSKTTVYHDFSGYNSSGYDTDFQSGISRWDSKPSTARSSDFKRDSSSGDDSQIQSTNSTLQNQDFKSVDHIEDLNTENLNNNLEPYSDKIQEKPIHKD